MKKILSIVILITIGITQIYSQCYQCNNTIASGEQATSVGMSTTASGNNSFAGGNSSNANGTNSFVFGDNSAVTGIGSIGLGTQVKTLFDGGIAIGNYATSNAANSYVFGQYLNATGSNSLTFGMGASARYLTNNIDNSIMFGVTNHPSLTIVKPTNKNIGYIGIGTDDPQTMAHVVGTLLIERTGTTESSLQFRHPTTTRGIDPGTGNPQTATYYWDIYSDTDGLKFNSVIYSTNPTPSPKMVISGGGYVGIGTTTPKARLHVDNNIIADGNITTLNNFVLATDYSSNLDHWEISRTSDGLNYAFKNKKITRDVLFMGNDGSIGVGTPEPSTTLEVNGSLKATSATITGNLTANGVDLVAMNALLFQKVEELSLYIIQMENRLAELEGKKGGE